MCKCDEKIIANPAQMVFTFCRYMYETSYNDGYNTGLAWDANWIAGGPYVYRPSRTGVPKFDKMAEESRQYAEDWNNGFADGLAELLKTNHHFKAWFDKNKGGRHKRYKLPQPWPTIYSNMLGWKYCFERYLDNTENFMYIVPNP